MLTEGIKILAEKANLTPTKWIRLIESRRVLIKPYLDSFTLPELGKVKCMMSEGTNYSKHDLGWDIFEADKGRHYLKLQGIFCIQSQRDKKKDAGFFPPPGGIHVPDGTRYGWGLTRSNQWVAIEIEFQGAPGYKDRGREVATSLKVKGMNLAGVLAETGYSPEQIYQTLGNVVRGWRDSRKTSYESIEAVAHAMDTEDALLGAFRRS